MNEDYKKKKLKNSISYLRWQTVYEFFNVLRMMLRRVCERLMCKVFSPKHNENSPIQ